MRLKFGKQRFAGDRTYQPGEVGEVDDEIGAQIVMDGDAVVTEKDVTVFKASEPAEDPAEDSPKDPPPKTPKK